MTSTGEVFLELYGDDFEPDDVSEFIGLAATRILRKGALKKDVPLPRKSAWRFSTGEIEDDVIDVFAMSESLVKQLAPYAPRIVEAKRVFGLTCVLEVVLWIDKDETKSMPAIGFDYPVIDFLKAVGGSIDVDTYRH